MAFYAIEMHVVICLQSVCVEFFYSITLETMTKKSMNKTQKAEDIGLNSWENIAKISETHILGNAKQGLPLKKNLPYAVFRSRIPKQVQMAVWLCCLSPVRVRDTLFLCQTVPPTKRGGNSKREDRTVYFLCCQWIKIGARCQSARNGLKLNRGAISCWQISGSGPPKSHQGGPLIILYLVFLIHKRERIKRQ